MAFVYRVCGTHSLSPAKVAVDSEGTGNPPAGCRRTERDSILTLFEPLLDPGAHPYEMQEQPIETSFVRCHACMFMRTGAAQQRLFADKFLKLLHSHIARTTRLFLQPSYAVGIANCCAMVEYGSKSDVILQVIDSVHPKRTQTPGATRPELLELLEQATSEILN